MGLRSICLTHPRKGVTTIRPGDATARITAGISPYTIALLAIAVTLGVVAWRRKVSR
jgi:hypothetical protein